mgnify:FL=1
MKKYTKQWLLILAFTLTCAGLSGCALFKEKKNELDGTITGNTYQAAFYSNDGDKFMTMSGQKINLKSNIVDEYTYTSGGWGYVQTLSSVVTVIIDGREVESCGSTMIFAEDGLEPEVDFKAPEIITSTASGIADNTAVAGVVNRYRTCSGNHGLWSSSPSLATRSVHIPEIRCTGRSAMTSPKRPNSWLTRRPCISTGPISRLSIRHCCSKKSRRTKEKNIL